MKLARAISVLALALACQGCRTTPLASGDPDVEPNHLQRGLKSYRDGRWHEARAALGLAGASGHALAVAPFMAAAAMVEGQGETGLDRALEILLEAHQRATDTHTERASGAVVIPGEVAPLAPPGLREVDVMIAHAVEVGFRRAVAIADSERARDLHARLPETRRFQKMRSRLAARLAVLNQTPDAESRLQAARSLAPFDLDLAVAARRLAFAAGRYRDALDVMARLAPPRGEGDELMPRWRRMEAAVAAGDRAAITRAAAALGWLDEVADRCAVPAADSGLSRDRAAELARDVAAIRAIAGALATYHADATANASATARARGASLEQLDSLLRTAASAAGLELAPARIERPLPLVAEVDCIAPLVAGLEPPAVAGRDTVAELMGRYGLALDLLEGFGAADGRLFHAAGLFRATARGWGNAVETWVLVGDDTIVPGGVPLRLGAGGIAGRACMTRAGVLILADALRPSLAHLDALERLARGGRSARQPRLPMASWSLDRTSTLAAGFFDLSWSRERAYREVFLRELDHTLRHELGHVLDFETLLPLHQHLDKTLSILFAGGFQASRIEARFEEGAESYALGLALYPRFAAFHGQSRLAIDAYRPGVLLAVAAGSDPWRTSYVRAAERLASSLDEVLTAGELISDAELQAVGARRAFELAIPWPGE